MLTDWDLFPGCFAYPIRGWKPPESNRIRPHWLPYIQLKKGKKGSCRRWWVGSVTGCRRGREIDPRRKRRQERSIMRSHCGGHVHAVLEGGTWVHHHSIGRRGFNIGRAHLGSLEANPADPLPPYKLNGGGSAFLTSILWMGSQPAGKRRECAGDRVCGLGVTRGGSRNSKWVIREGREGSSWPCLWCMAMWVLRRPTPAALGARCNSGRRRRSTLVELCRCRAFSLKWDTIWRRIQPHGVAAEISSTDHPPCCPFELVTVSGRIWLVELQRRRLRICQPKLITSCRISPPPCSGIRRRMWTLRSSVAGELCPAAGPVHSRLRRSVVWFAFQDPLRKSSCL